MNSIWRRALAVARTSEFAIMLCYAAGLLATHAVGEGAAGQPLLGLAAPAIVGLLIRYRRPLKPTDGLRLIAVHIGFAIVNGDPIQTVAPDFMLNLLAIVAGTLTFNGLRSSGFITSQVRVGAAVAIAAASMATLACLQAVIGSGGAMALSAVAIHGLAAGVSAALLLMVVLTFDRDDGAFARSMDDIGERGPAWWEYAAAALTLAILVGGAIGDGRQEAALGGSVALLWFATRLGLFATSVAAFSFVAGLLALAAGGHWPALMSAGDPVEAELLRYAALALLSIPSLLVAAAVHDQKSLRRAFAYRAMHDGLTSLVNRSRFIEVLDSATSAARSRGKRFALLMIDLDHFKSVNDSYGHARGDALLIEIANRLRNSTRATDVVARIGGDEFAVVAPVPTVEDAMRLAKRLVETVNKACDVGGVTFVPSITVGGVLSPDAAGDPERLLLLADEALYQAKAAGRNCWRFSSAGEENAVTPVWRAGDLEAVAETVFLD